jgi:hypothetical protein
MSWSRLGSTTNHTAYTPRFSPSCCMYIGNGSSFSGLGMFEDTDIKYLPFLILPKIAAMFLHLHYRIQHRYHELHFQSG